MSASTTCSPRRCRSARPRARRPSRKSHTSTGSRIRPSVSGTSSVGSCSTSIPTTRSRRSSAATSFACSSRCGSRIPPANGGMRPLDDIDRRILQALVDDGRAPWTTLARVVDVPDSTVYRRTAALFDEGRVRVGVLPIVPVESARLYELRLRCRPGRQRDVARKLAERRDMRWVAVVTGDYGVAAELVVPAGADPAAVIFDDIEQRDDNILASQSSVLMHTFKLPHNLEQGFVYDPRLEVGDLGADERALLAVLAEDGRKSYASAATEVGANESTIRRRLRTLLRAGGAGTVTVVHPPSLGFEHEA